MDKTNPTRLTRAQWKAFYNDTKLFNSLVRCRYYCRCGHTVIITPKQDRAMCDWCNNWVYKDPAEQQKHDAILKERESLLKFKKEMRKYL